MLGKLLGRKSENIVGLDISSSSIKLVQLSSSQSGPVLTRANIVELPPSAGSVEKTYIRDSLKQLVAETGVSGNTVVVAIGCQEVYLRELILPQMPTSELREAIKWELEKYLTQAVEKYYFDFAVQETTAGQQQIKVLVVAARREAVDNLVSMVAEAGLKPAAVEIEPLAWQRTLAHSADNVLLIDVGARITQITLLQAAIPVVVRAIEVGGQAFTKSIMAVLDLPYDDAERLKQRQEGLLPAPELPGERSPLQNAILQVVEDLAREIQRTVNYYQKQHPGSQVDKLLITGGGARLANFPQQLEFQLKVPVSVTKPLNTVTISPVLDAGYMQTISQQLAIALGLALRGASNDTN